MTETAAASGDENTYGGLFGAFPYAFRRSDSRLFRAYVVVGGLLAALLAIVFGLAFVVSVAQSTGLAAGGTSSFVRTFVLLVGFLVVLPVIAPVLLVARHHRRIGSDARYDRALATAGAVYLASVYLFFIASAPPALRSEPSGALAPVVAVLYAIPSIASPAVPLAAAALLWGVHRRYR